MMVTVTFGYCWPQDVALPETKVLALASQTKTLIMRLLYS